MKYSFRNPDEITMEATDDGDAKWLRSIVENRDRISFVIGNWQSDTDPMARKFEATEPPAPGAYVLVLNLVPCVDGKVKE